MSINKEPSRSLYTNEEKGFDEILFQAGTSLHALNSIAKRPPVNILFKDIEYTVSSFRGTRQFKPIFAIEILALCYFNCFSNQSRYVVAFCRKYLGTMEFDPVISGGIQKMFSYGRLLRIDVFDCSNMFFYAAGDGALGLSYIRATTAATVPKYRELKQPNREKRQILRSISGEFRSGDLTCILGPSGAGKSSLLHILTGYNQNGVKGEIKINGDDRDMRIFKKLNCYIMHDDILQPRLTTLESMRIAAELKLGAEIKKANKEVIVTEVLQTLGLWRQRHTMCERLSGGQSKRLAIALELVNNPPVIFLDEPTSGLDIVSVKQLLLLLRLLSRQGRTIICTIHQPSASLFNLFDNAYVICGGQCCYQGAPSQLVPFLAEARYICPPSHNPADFVIETLVGEMTATKQLSDLCQNGKLCRLSQHTSIQLNTLEESRNDKCMKEVSKNKSLNVEFPTSFCTQYLILMKRVYLQGKRKQLNWFIQLMQYILCGLFVGGIFYMVGNEGSTPMANFKSYICITVFLIYTYTMVPILLLPMEIRIIRREYFNRWYGLKAYYAALTCSTIPPAIFFGMIFITMTYFMTGQLFEWYRFISFSIIGLLTGFCSEGLGLVIGSILNGTNGAILGPSIISPLLVLCCYGMGFGRHIEPGMRYLMSLSYLRYGLTGMTLPLYQNRTRMHCSEDACLYGDPIFVLQELGMDGETYMTQILGLTVFIVLFRTIAYFTLRHRLTNEYPNSII